MRRSSQPHRRSSSPPAGSFSGARERPASERFRSLDTYRAEREWARYEGTAQRDLWRELRERFLGRHRAPASWALDVGSGPGRFTQYVGSDPSRRVAMDVSREMLRTLDVHWRRGPDSEARPDRVRADARFPPFKSGSFGEVALLGNTLGFAEASAERLRQSAASLVLPGGMLVIEVAPGPGEQSRYLGRLPPTSLARLFRAPVRALLPRIEREGFEKLPFRRAQAGTFRRIPVSELARSFAGSFEIREVLAVAPALGAHGSRVGAVARDGQSWGRLLEVEEELGHRPERWTNAAAVLVAAEASRLQ